MFVTATSACGTIVLEVCCYTVCMKVHDRFDVDVTLSYMFFDLVANNLTFITIFFFTFVIMCVVIQLVLEGLFDQSFDIIGGNDGISLLDQRRSFFL